MALSGLNDVSIDTVDTKPHEEVKQASLQPSEVVVEQPKPKTKAKRKTKPVSSQTDSSCFIRNIPTNVIKAIRAEFSDATNNQDALMAYLACHGSGTVAERANANLTETQRKLVDSWDGDSYQALVKQMERMAARMDSAGHMIEVIQLLSAYMVYDRLGFRSSELPQTPKDTNLREDGVMDMLLAVEEQSTGFQHEKNTILGRPIRK